MSCYYSFLPPEGMKDDEAQPNLQTPDTQQMHYYAFRLHTNTKPRRSKEMKKSRVKMFLRCSYILWISILCEAVSGDNVMKAVNSETVFTPVSGSVYPSTTSITWKHKDNGVVVKVIEWEREDDSTVIPNPKFRSHASLNKQTGELTLKHLLLKHTGVYTLDISGKEQRKQFVLTVIEPVRKPYIIKKDCEQGDVPKCSLSCESDDGASGSAVIWKSSGETLHGRDQQTRTITVTESSDPDNSYTCTLKSAVNEETSDPVYDRDLFHDSFTISDIVIIIVSVISVVLLLILLWCLWRFRKRCLQSIFTKDEWAPFRN